VIEVIFGAFGAEDGGADVAELKKGSRVTGGERDRLAADLRRKYDGGESIRALAQSTGRSYGFVHRILSESGASLRGRGGATRGAATRGQRIA
jgi:Helix-turn-helix domain